jgi:hypothetical protein
MAAEKKKRTAHNATTPVVTAPETQTSGNKYFNFALILSARLFVTLLGAARPHRRHVYG